jgi:hypothetical protein
MSEWQPIDSAPNDTGPARAFLAYCPDNDCTFAVTRRDGLFQWWGGHGACPHRLTHWMPLPEPPTKVKP